MEEVDKVVKTLVNRPCGRFIEATLEDNMLVCLDFSKSTWTVCGLIGEEALFVFAYGSMACSHVGEVHAE